MNLNFAWPALVAVLFLALSGGALRAVEWKTTDGKVYENVKLIKLDADSVTILHAEGGARIPLANLPPDLQKRFGYEPELAQAAADARAKEKLLDEKALRAERDRAARMQPAGKMPVSTATDTAATSEEATGPVTPGTAPTSPPPVAASGSHHFMDGIATSGSSRPVAAGNGSHQSIGDATQSAAAMRPDLNDPNYHTMAHMFYTVRKDGLAPDRNGAPHYSIGDTTAAAAPGKK